MKRHQRGGLCLLILGIGVLTMDIAAGKVLDTSIIVLLGVQILVGIGMTLAE